MSFKHGERLRFQLRFYDAENAKNPTTNVLIRFLPSGAEPSSPDGIEGGIQMVPDNGILTVTLERDHPDVQQISVHGGKEAWNYRLGDNNGKVRLISVNRVK
ncbi:MAG: hypothetical protein LBH31_10175 [Burkholderiaceae bacterium]|nr:hypothetical protein [Burkholderiaceae bacterium]